MSDWGDVVLHVTGEGPNRTAALLNAAEVAKQYYGDSLFELVATSPGQVDEVTRTVDATGKAVTTYAMFTVICKYSS